MKQDEEKEKKVFAQLELLKCRKDSILIKYRKKFELLKANKIRNIIFRNNKNE